VFDGIGENTYCGGIERMFATEEKYGIIRKKHHMYAKSDFMSALRTLTEEERNKLWKELEENGIIKRKSPDCI
jgi:hypothetical protein